MDGLTLEWSEPDGICLRCAECLRMEVTARCVDRTERLARAIIDAMGMVLDGRCCSLCRKAVATVARSTWLRTTLESERRYDTRGAAPCKNCQRPLLQMRRGVCFTCWRKDPDEMARKYPAGKRGPKPKWLMEGCPDPAAFARRVRAKRQAAKEFCAAKNEKPLSTNVLARREIIPRADQDELMRVALSVTESLSPFQTDQLIGPAFEGVIDAYRSGVNSETELKESAKAAIKRHWQNESDIGVKFLDDMKEDFGYQPVYAEEG